MPKKYKKKPVVIEAVKFTGKNFEEISSFTGSPVDVDKNGEIQIHTLEGTMLASAGDFVIRGVNGEFYPCKPDIFAKTYEDA